MKCVVVQAQAIVLALCALLYPGLPARASLLPPTIAIVSPTNGTSIGSADLSIAVAAADADGIVTAVDFYGNGIWLGASATPPFTFTDSNIVAGSYALVAVAHDDTGLNSTSAPVSVAVPPRLIPSGAGWKYLDDGSDPGPAWKTAAFNDAGWSNGVAQLGFGEGDEVTLLRQYSTLTQTNVITYYFRRSFDVPTPAGITNLVLRLVRDDGAVVYLNGTEVFRINMPPGPISPTNLAASIIPSDNTFHATHVNPALLAPGPNVVAVEMHQGNPTSSDLSFDLELRPNVPPTRPTVSVVAPTDNDIFYGPTNVGLSALALDMDDAVISTAFYLSNTLAGTDLTESYAIDGQNFSLTASNLDAGDYLIRAVATDAGGLSTTSAPVRFRIVYAPVITTLLATGSVWKYLDTGVDQGTAWRSPGFNDSAWKTGQAKFGTNDPATTIIHIMPTDENVTAYFRTRFTAVGAASYTNLYFRVLRDDGVVGYLNGVEIFRNNMPAGEVLFSTFAVNAIGGTNENYYIPINADPQALFNGTNVLAVELHQSRGSTDAGFDLGLVGIALPAAIAPALNIQLTPSSVVLSWLGNGFTLQEATAVEGPYLPLASGTNYYVFPRATGNRCYRLFKP